MNGVRRWLNAVRRSAFCSVFGARCSVFGVRCSVIGCSVFSVLRCSVRCDQCFALFGVGRLAFSVWRSAFRVRRSAFSVRRSAFGVRAERMFGVQVERTFMFGEQCLVPCLIILFDQAIKKFLIFEFCIHVGISTFGTK